MPDQLSPELLEALEAVETAESAEAAKSRSLGNRLSGLPAAAVAFARSHPLRALLVGVAGLVSLVVVGVFWYLIAGYMQAEEPIDLDTTLAVLDQGDLEEAARMARVLQSAGTLPLEQWGGPPYVLGVAAAREADETYGPDRPARYLLAARYLEEAQDRGFPAGREGRGLFLLGKCLFLGGRVPAGRVVLREALEAFPEQRAETLRLLAAACADESDPRLDEALEYNSQLLAQPALSSRQRDAALLQRARILLQLGRLDECEAQLNAMSPQTEHRSEAMVVRARVLMERARALTRESVVPSDARLKARAYYQQAIKALRQAQSRDTLENEATRRAMYLIGVCFLEMNDRRAAWAQLQRVRKLYVKWPEGLAATFHQAELARRAGRDAEALAVYRSLLKAVPDPAAYRNPWLPLDQLRKQMLATYEHYLETQRFEVALQLARVFHPLFSRNRAAELAAQACRQWADSLLAQAEQSPPHQAEALRREARERLRRAAQFHVYLSRLEVTTPRYSERLWQAAEAFLAGQDYRNAVTVLRKYLDDQTRKRHALGLVYLGEALLAQDKLDEALQAFDDCLTYHARDAATYRARLLASRAHMERGELDQAETLLRENLIGELLTPASREWRDSLFALGKLEYMQARYDQAVHRLNEAVARYPDDPRSSEARFLAAQCWFRRAVSARRALGAQPGSESAEQPRVHEWLVQAAEGYARLLDDLEQRQQTHELTALDQAILRNCYFACAAVQFELGDYQAAIRACRAATIRYQRRPEVLEAYVQMARAYRRLGQAREARTTLKQAKVVLARLDAQADFATTTNYTREQWSRLLDQLAGS